jgi:molybdenum cofactor biosynthesis protein B
LSRAIGGLLGGKVVLALPGSPKALRLAMDEIVLKEAGHLVSQTRG